MDQPRGSSTLDWTRKMNTGTRTTRPDLTLERKTYEYWQPAYRYGYASAQRYPNKTWDTVDADLRSGWDRYEQRRHANSTWEQVKQTVRDAWNRIVGSK